MLIRSSWDAASAHQLARCPTRSFTVHSGVTPMRSMSSKESLSRSEWSSAQPASSSRISSPLRSAIGVRIELEGAVADHDLVAVPRPLSLEGPFHARLGQALLERGDGPRVIEVGVGHPPLHV